MKYDCLDEFVVYSSSTMNRKDTVIPVSRKDTFVHLSSWQNRQKVLYISPQHSNPTSSHCASETTTHAIEDLPHYLRDCYQNGQ